jgi:hypothetical protein
MPKEFWRPSEQRSEDDGDGDTVGNAQINLKGPSHQNRFVRKWCQWVGLTEDLRHWPLKKWHTYLWILSLSGCSITPPAGLPIYIFMGWQQVSPLITFQCLSTLQVVLITLWPISTVLLLPYLYFLLLLCWLCCSCLVSSGGGRSSRCNWRKAGIAPVYSTSNRRNSLMLTYRDKIMRNETFSNNLLKKNIILNSTADS